MVNKWPPCNKCGMDVTTEMGAVGIDEIEIEKAMAARRAWAAEHREDTAISLEDLAGFPPDAKWRWAHLECMAESEYQLTGDRFDTLGKALDWTLHWSEKGWLSCTDWNEFVRRVHDVPSA